MPKYIFVTGGVISGIGKGITTASIARVLLNRGYKVTCIKCDMYVNVDAGTMNPTEHGEVFVTEDGMETDQDIGHYERFLNTNLSSANYTTTGQVYQSVIQRERNLEYQGACVEVVPHIPEEIIRRIKEAGRKSRAEIVIVEIGGTVGEYQNILFLEADRIMKVARPKDVINVHVSYLPIPKSLGEQKTKPVQYSVRTLNSAGIQPEFIIGRSQKALDQKRIKKISIFCSVPETNVISNPDVNSIYKIPVLFEEQKLGRKILHALGLKTKKLKTKEWENLVKIIKKVKDKVNIGIVGKYFTTGKFTLEDSYVSVIEAIKHAAWHHNLKPKIQWIDCEKYEKDKKNLEELKEFDGVIVPGGYGERGVEGKILAIRYLRENKIPFFGLCYGMQLACIEFARNVCGIIDAHTTEIRPKTKNPIIHIMPRQKKYLLKHQYGGTMRLGAWPCKLKKDSLSFLAYKKRRVLERHRHRYEFNNKYRERFIRYGLRFTGVTPDNELIEIIELENHPWFVGVQFHPEFKSRPLHPHPLYKDFIKACIKRHQKNRLDD